MIMSIFSLFACAHWKPSTWSACSVTCGTGQQQRVVQCVRDGASGSTNVVHDSECDAVYSIVNEKLFLRQDELNF